MRKITGTIIELVQKNNYMVCPCEENTRVPENIIPTMVGHSYQGIPNNGMGILGTKMKR